MLDTSTNALIEGYTYDPLGNRRSKTNAAGTLAYLYNTANQLTEIHQGTDTGTVLATLGYDFNGSLTTKTEGATLTSIGYDAVNRLVQVAKTGQATQSYVYDAEERRVSKTVGSTVTQYLYNGPDILAEYGASWAAATATYTHGPNLDDPIIRATASGTQYFHQDGLGSVVAVSDATGVTTGSVRYDAWGQVLATTGTIPQYGYTGREPDETGLVYYRGRYYDPALARFTQRDPIGFQGGGNLYAYVNNNPTNFTDPWGLTPRTVLDSGLTVNTSYYNTGSSMGGLNPGSQSLAGMNSSPYSSGSFFRATVPGQIAFDNAVNAFQSGDFVAGALYGAQTLGEAVFTVLTFPETALVGATNLAVSSAVKSMGRSTADDLASAASRAVEAVGPGKGGVYGTKVHSAFESEVNSLGRSDLSTEVSYLNGKVVPRGTTGSVRLDVVEGPVNAPTAVHDLKTGSAKLTPGRVQKIQSHIPGGCGVPVCEVRP